MKPQIRFSGNKDEWVAQMLSDCLEVCNVRNTSNTYGKEDALSVSDDCGVVNQIKHLGRSYTGADVSNYKVLNSGQIVYTKSPLKAKPYGVVKMNGGNVGIVSVLYAVYNTTGIASPRFLNYYFDPAARLNKYLLPLINKGAKNTINISDEMFLNGNINLPSDITEQEQIATFFEKLGILIQASAKKIESLKQLKAASMISMFPQKGETRPRIRFKGFDGDWIETKLADLSKKVIKKNLKMEYSVTFTNSAEFGIINQLDFFDHEISNRNSIRNYYIVEDDDFVYNPRVSVTAPVGPINRNTLGYTGVVSPLYYVFKVTGIDKNFLSCYFKTSIWHKFLKDNGNSGARFDRLSITDENFVKMPIIHPKSELEQEKIAAFFASLDKQISLETQRLEKLKQIKSACLDKMFV